MISLFPVPVLKPARPVHRVVAAAMALLLLVPQGDAKSQPVRPRPVPVAPRPVPVRPAAGTTTPRPAPVALAPSNVPADATAIESNSMQMDQARNIGIFFGNVRVTSKAMRLKCRELQVYFSPPPDGKPQRILALGDVEIVEVNRTTKAGRVEYDLNTKVVVLTERPQIVEPKTRVNGNKITIDRTTDTVEVEKSILVMQDGIDTGPGADKKLAPLPGQEEAKIPTTIVSESMRMDQGRNIAAFIGGVKVTTKDLKLSCNEMYVTFAQPVPHPALPGQEAPPEGPKHSSKPEKILAIGDVDIQEAARHTQAGQADYDLVSKIIILTVRPEISEAKTLVRGDIIKIDRASDTVEVEKSTLVLQYGIDGDNKDNKADAQPETLPR